MAATLPSRPTRRGPARVVEQAVRRVSRHSELREADRGRGTRGASLPHGSGAGLRSESTRYEAAASDLFAIELPAIVVPGGGGGARALLLPVLACRFDVRGTGPSGAAALTSERCPSPPPQARANDQLRPRVRQTRGAGALGPDATAGQCAAPVRDRHECGARTDGRRDRGCRVVCRRASALRRSKSSSVVPARTSGPCVSPSWPLGPPRERADAAPGGITARSMSSVMVEPR